MPARAQSRSQGIRALVSSPHLPASEQSDVHEAVEKTQMRSGPTGIQVWALRPSARLPPLVSGLGFPAVGRDACLAHLSGPMEDRGCPDGEGGSKTVTLTFLLQETTHPSRLPHPPFPPPPPTQRSLHGGHESPWWEMPSFSPPLPGLQRSLPSGSSHSSWKDGQENACRAWSRHQRQKQVNPVRSRALPET